MPLAMTDCPDCGRTFTSQGTCPNCGFALVECGQPPPQKDPPAQASAAASDFPPAPAGSLLNTVLTVTALFVALVVAVSGADPNRSLPAAIAMYVGLPYVVIMGIRLKFRRRALGTAFIWLGSVPLRAEQQVRFFFEDLFVILMITLVAIGLACWHGRSLSAVPPSQGPGCRGRPVGPSLRRYRCRETATAWFAGTGRCRRLDAREFWYLGARTSHCLPAAGVSRHRCVIAPA